MPSQQFTAPAAGSPVRPQVQQEQLQEERFQLPEAPARVDDNHELLAEMAEFFLQESSRFVSEFRTAREKNDHQTFTFAAHTSKVSVGNFAAPEASRQLEQMGRKGELEGAGVIQTQLQIALGLLHPALKVLDTLKTAN